METIKIGELKVKTNKVVQAGEVVDPMHVFGTSIDTNKYKDITSNDAWMNIGSSNYDYLFCRAQIMVHTATQSALLGGFSGMTEFERKIAARNFAVGPSDRLSVYTDDELSNHWDKFIKLSQSTRRDRWNKSKSYISYILPMADSIDVGIKTTELTNNYITYGIEDFVSDGVVGLFDWVENTNTYSGGTGFSGQTYWTQTLQDNLTSILRYGYKV